MLRIAPVLALAAACAPPPATLAAAQTPPPPAALIERYPSVEVASAGVDPRWAPDGRHIAWDVPGEPRRWVLAAVEPDGSVRRIAELEGRGASFSPAGRRVAWLRPADPAAGETHARVRVRELATGREHDVATREAVRAVAWSGCKAVPWVRGDEVRTSPGGTHLVFPDDAGLAVLTIETGWQRTFVGSDHPVFSADGSTLVFITRSAAGHALRRVRLDERGEDADLPELLFGTADVIASPAVSADGEVVAFLLGAGPGRAVRVVGDDWPRPRRLEDARDELPRLLTGARLMVVDGEPVSAPAGGWAVAPDGQWVLVGEGGGVRLVGLGREWR